MSQVPETQLTIPNWTCTNTIWILVIWTRRRFGLHPPDNQLWVVLKAVDHLDWEAQHMMREQTNLGIKK